MIHYYGNNCNEKRKKMIANGGCLCYTDCMCVWQKQRNVNRMKILPKGCGWKILAAVIMAAAGNFLVQYVIPWPDFMVVSYEKAAEEFLDYPVEVYLILTLFIAPLFEEGIFRRGIYGTLRKWLGAIPAGVLSALVFGLYHGNWIQVIYGFAFGLLLAWGYEDSSFGKYRVVVLMHGAANGAAVLFSVFFGVCVK